MPPARIDPERLRVLIETERKTQHEAARILGVSRCCVGRTCKRLGLETQRSGPRSGPDHTGWKGGTKMLKGYRYIYCPDHPNATKQGYVAEHRLAMEKHLGRYLTSEEVVHHIRRPKTNNHISNLELFATNADHLRHELTGQVPNWTPEGKARMTGRPKRTPSPDV